MLNSRTKDKIYAFLSLLVIILVIGSFMFIVRFLVETNKYIFSVNEATVKEKTTVVDKAGFGNVIEKLITKEVSGAEKFQIKKIPPVKEKSLPEASPVDDALLPNLSPVPSLAPSQYISPDSSPEIAEDAEMPVLDPGE